MALTEDLVPRGPAQRDFSVTGIMLSPEDVKRFENAAVSALVIFPGVELDRKRIQQQLHVPTYLLADLADGTVDYLSLSREISPVINEFFDEILPRDLPPEYGDCRNDIYSYHLRTQYYGLRLLEEFARRYRPGKVILNTVPYRKYWSPERPARRFLHAPERAEALLVRRLCEAMGLPVETPCSGPEGRLVFAAQRGVRKAAIVAYKVARVLQKARAAKAHEVSLARPQTNHTGVAFILRGASEVATVEPVIRALESIENTTVTLIRDELLLTPGVKQQLESRGLTYVSIGSKLGVWGVLKAFLKASFRPRMRIRRVPSASGGPTALAVVANSWDIWCDMAERAAESYGEQLWFEQELTGLCGQIRPSAIVTCSMVDLWGPTIARVGRSSGARVIAIQNATHLPETFPQMGWADLYCVQSTSLRERMVRAGFPPNRITATGLPHLSTENVPENWRRDQTERPCVLVTTQPHLHLENTEMVRATALACKAAGASLRVKLHPREVEANYKGLMDEILKFLPEAELTHGDSVEQAMTGVALLVSRMSTTILRAITMGVPAIAYAPAEYRHLRIDYLEHPVTYTVREFDDLTAALIRILGDYSAYYNVYVHRRSDFLEREAFINAGSPTTNIVSVILGHAAQE